MEKAEYSDAIILALRARYQKANATADPVGDSIYIGSIQSAVRRVSLLEKKCSMLLPESMEDMPEWERKIQYRNKNRPPVIKVAPDRTATFTLGWIEEITGESVKDRLEKIRRDMKKVWRQNVFYDSGIVQTEEFPVAWMDFKAFCMNGNFYGMVFLFEIGTRVFIGNFHCSFAQYDIWKPVMLKLFTTILSEEEKRGADESRAD